MIICYILGSYVGTFPGWLKLIHKTRGIEYLSTLVGELIGFILDHFMYSIEVFTQVLMGYIPITQQSLENEFKISP